MQKNELDQMINIHMNEFVKNLKNMAKKYRINITTSECYEIINICYVKLYEKMERDNQPIINIKNYFGMMTYNAYGDYLAQQNKNKEKLLIIPNINYSEIAKIATDEPSFGLDEVEHQKLILDILQNLSKILTKEQFDIFIKKTINKKSCKQISQELNKPYRWTTNQYKLAKEIVLNQYGDWWKKIIN